MCEDGGIINFDTFVVSLLRAYASNCRPQARLLGAIRCKAPKLESYARNRPHHLRSKETGSYKGE